MALDNRQDRMSALNISCPWRGPLVDAAEAGFSRGNRQAADYFYSGVPVGVVLDGGGKQFIGEIQQIGIASVMNTSMGQG